MADVRGDSRDSFYASFSFFFPSTDLDFYFVIQPNTRSTDRTLAWKILNLLARNEIHSLLQPKKKKKKKITFILSVQLFCAMFYIFFFYFPCSSKWIVRLSGTRRQTKKELFLKNSAWEISNQTKTKRAIRNIS